MIRHAAVAFAARILAGMLVLPSAIAADTTTTALPTLALRAARLLDVKSGRYVPDAVVLISAGTISAAGSKLAVPPGANVIDLGDVTLLPGLIDCHTHLMMRLGKDEEYGTHLLTRSDAARALEGAADARATLRAGYTTVRDTENEGSGYADVALRDAIAAGLVEGPRLQVATRGIAAVGQYVPFGIRPDLAGFPTGAQMVSGPEEARRAVREQIGHGADLIKVYADWETPTLTPEELGVIVAEAHKLHRKVAAHATTPEGIRNAVVAGVDSIEHGEEPDAETLKMMKARGTFLVSTAAVVAAFKDEAKNDAQRAYVDDRLQPLPARPGSGSPPAWTPPAPRCTARTPGSSRPTLPSAARRSRRSAPRPPWRRSCSAGRTRSAASSRVTLPT
jgi:imidazolonepropionase-like amidohydrolase